MSGADRVLRVVDGGLLSSVQDLGRTGVGWMGVSPSGVADSFSARIANRLVYNDDNAALIETTMTGATFTLECAARIAVTGARGALTIGGKAREMWRAHDVTAGETIAVARAEAGLRAYVALDGGLDIAQVLRSASTDIGAGFGGHGGKRLAAGDRLPLRDVENGGVRDALGRLKPLLAFDSTEVPNWTTPAGLSVLQGPHALRIGVHALHDLCDREYRVSLASNRQALRLEGDAIEVVGGTDVISEGMCAGCIQVASDGLPIILLSEHQTTGGYAAALCVCAADLPRAAQVAPGGIVRFARVSFAEAAAMRDALARRLARIVPLEATAKLGGGFFEGA